jgi:hypothetical protein
MNVVRLLTRDVVDVRIVGLLCLASTMAGCSDPPPPPEAIARYSGGYVMAVEVERQLGLAPRRMDPSRDPREWVARRIAWRKLLVERWANEAYDSPGRQLALHGAECRVLVGALMEELAQAVEVAPEAVDAEVERQRELAGGRKEVLRVRHIYRRADPTMSPSDRSAQLELMERLLLRVRDGENFEALARKYSQSETAAAGGLLDGLQRSVVDEEFERAAFALDKGEVSDVVTTPRGYHIVRLEERFMPPPFVESDVRPLILNQLRHRALQRQRTALVSSLKEAGGYTAGWDAEGKLYPDEVGAVLRVEDVTVTVDDLEALGGQASVFGGPARSVVDRLDELLDGELLCRESLRRGLVAEDQLSVLREQLSRDLTQEAAERRELRELRSAVSDEEIERFIADFPRRVAVPGDVSVEIVWIGYRDPEAFDLYTRARSLAERARSGTDLAVLGADLEADGVALLLEERVLQPERLSEYGPEVAHAVNGLETGHVTDVVRLGPANRRVADSGDDGAFVIVRLLERQAERSLDPAVDGEELRRRYWKRFGAAILEQRMAEDLARAGFELMGPG